jgi:hypothetical protein
VAGHRPGVAGDGFREALIFYPIRHLRRRAVVDQVHDRNNLQLVEGGTIVVIEI